MTLIPMTAVCESIEPWEVTKGLLIIGRDAQIDKQPVSWRHLNDEKVSRRHVALLYTNSIWLLVDLASTNGVFVRTEQDSNWKRVGTDRLQNPLELEDGWLLRVGKTVFKVQIG